MFLAFTQNCNNAKPLEKQEPNSYYECQAFFYSPLCGCLSLMRCFVCWLGCFLFGYDIMMMMMFSSLCNSPLTISFSTLTLLMSAPLMKNKNAQAAYRFSRPRRRNQVRASSACLHSLPTGHQLFLRTEWNCPIVWNGGRLHHSALHWTTLRHFLPGRGGWQWRGG